MIKELNDINYGYISLCYHYVRPEKNIDPFPKLLGTRINEFEKHVKMLKDNFELISLKQAYDFSHDNLLLKEKPGLLISFDDGLSDHFTAAKILNKYNIKAVFFIPTCIIEDNLPANPIIIHYAIEKFGIAQFLTEYESSLKKFKIEKNELSINYDSKIDNPWKIIDRIKLIFKYKFSNMESRKILLDIYEKLLLNKFPNFMEIAHLTSSQINQMLEMGHSIGVHTHSHISVAASNLQSKEFHKEMIHPKKILEENFKTEIISFSYPYGERKDCLATKKLLKYANQYKMAFTVEQKVNYSSTSLFELGRYEPYSSDNTSNLKENLMRIIKGKKL
jgi:peptidoglycan/xylan/chitin deacetylase (PgdA/CDA1 family)